MRRLAAIASALISIGAGLYLLGTQTVGANSILEVLAHGIGAYFVARGIFMGSSLTAQAEAAEALRELRDLTKWGAAEYAAEREPPEA